MHAFYQPQLSCARASNPRARWFIHPRRKQRGIKNLFRNSLNYQFLCFYKIIEGIRKRRQRLTTTAVEAAKARGGKLPSRNEERIPEKPEKQIQWLNSVYSVQQQWDDLALKLTFHEEAVGKKITELISEGKQLDTVRNKIAHAILRSEEPTLLIGETASLELVNRWLPLTKCIARHMLNKEFPDRHPHDPSTEPIVKLYRSRRFVHRPEGDHMEYDPVPGSLEFIRDMICGLRHGEVTIPALTIDIKGEGVATDADGHPSVIYVGMEVDDEGVERILFTGHFNLSASPPTWNMYYKRPRLG